MPGRFDGTVAVVTGAAAGIGRAAALALARDGARVAVVDRDRPGAESVAAVITDAGGVARAVPLDVTDADAVDAAFADVGADLGPVDVLVACAGGSDPADGPADALDVDVVDRTLAVDLRGMLLCAGAAVRSMRTTGRGGAIVTFATYHALAGGPGGDAYVAAKGGVVALTRAIAARHAGDGIRANCIAPGIVLSDRVRARTAAADVDLDAVRTATPGAVADPDEIASIALFLASSEARTVTGCTVVADGGLSLHRPPH